LFAAMIVSVSVLGCNRSQVAGAGCSSDQECIDQNGGLDRWFCNTKKSPPACDLHTQQCDITADCCPGQICKVEGHYCYDNYVQCTVDGSCPAQGEVCKTIGIFPAKLGCTWNRCNAGTCA